MRILAAVLLFAASVNAQQPAAPAPARPAPAITPVTDAMLQNPPPGEWPSWRRGSDGQGFSPLKQINKSNVAELRAAFAVTRPKAFELITW